MLDFIFFHETPFQLFVKFLEDKNIPSTIKIIDENYDIAIPENISDTLLDEVEKKYDELIDMNQEIFEQQEQQGSDNYSKASVAFKLTDGRISNASIDRKVIAKIMEVITPVEFTSMIDAIVTAVENPEERSICQKIQAGDFF
jgi:predicted RNA-binding protein